jgi:quinol monooxygenase YgiN
MLKHIVMWRLKDTAAGSTKLDNGRELKKRLDALKGKIAEIRRLEVGLNIDRSDTASDVVLYSEFADAEALAAYQRHPEHVKVVEFVREISAERRVVDYLD